METAQMDTNYINVTSSGCYYTSGALLYRKSHILKYLAAFIPKVQSMLTPSDFCNDQRLSKSLVFEKSQVFTHYLYSIFAYMIALSFQGLTHGIVASQNILFTLVC